MTTFVKMISIFHRLMYDRNVTDFHQMDDLSSSLKSQVIDSLKKFYDRITIIYNVSWCKKFYIPIFYYWFEHLYCIRNISDSSSFEIRNPNDEWRRLEKNSSKMVTKYMISNLFFKSRQCKSQRLFVFIQNVTYINKFRILQFTNSM